MNLSMKIVWGVVAIIACVALALVGFSEEKKTEDKEPQEAIVEKAFHTKDLSTFVTAIKTAKLEEVLTNKTPITIFAPNDSAFSTLPDGKFAELMQSDDKSELKEIVNYHIVPGKITVSDLKDGQVLTTLQGNKIRITVEGDKVLMNGTQLVKSNIEASNGIIHVIDKVMLLSTDVNKMVMKQQ